MGSDADYRCLWLETEWVGEYESAAEVALCHHPLGKGFCDYIEGGLEESNECPLYQARHPTSDIEEEIRQYLEYTEKREGK